MADRPADHPPANATTLVEASANSQVMDAGKKKAMAKLRKKSTDMKRLAEQIRSLLPPELYEMIFEFTFSADHSSSNSPGAPPAKILHEQHLRGVKIDKKYKPPALLRVSSKGRALFARSYYSNTVFHVKRENLIKWLRSLPPYHVNFLTEVRVYLPADGPDTRPRPATEASPLQRRGSSRARALLVDREFADIRNDVLSRTQMNSGKAVIYMRMRAYDSGRWFWWNEGTLNPMDVGYAEMAGAMGWPPSLH